VEGKQKGTERKLMKSTQGRGTNISWEASTDSAWCLAVFCLPYFDYHLGWKYNLIYVTCICNINDRS
jgi:hypothetical protein